MRVNQKLFQLAFKLVFSHHLCRKAVKLYDDMPPDAFVVMISKNIIDKTIK